MALPKRQPFSVTLEWKKDHEMLLHTREIPDIIVGPPVSFGGKPHYTIAQDLFLGSIATCLTSTFLTLAKLKHLKFSMLKTHVEGILEILDKDNVKFTEVTTTMHLALVDREDAPIARSAHKKTAETCVIDLTVKGALKMDHKLKLYLPE
ncbi:MAG: OsmC family protein [Candidatus Ranarchaeia archaeon]